MRSAAALAVPAAGEAEPHLSTATALAIGTAIVLLSSCVALVLARRWPRYGSRYGRHPDGPAAADAQQQGEASAQSLASVAPEPLLRISLPRPADLESPPFPARFSLRLALGC